MNGSKFGVSPSTPIVRRPRFSLKSPNSGPRYGERRSTLTTHSDRPEDNDQIIAATYRRYLPSEAELAAELEREHAEAERVLRLTAPSVGGGSNDP